MANLIDKVKNLLNEYQAKFGTQMKFMDMKLTDGTTIVRFPNEAIAVGDAVMVVTEQGEMPMPDNTPENPMYTLEDGSTFTVVNGVIETYTPMEEEATEQPETEVAATSDGGAATVTTPQAKTITKTQIEEHIFNEFKSATEKTISELTEKLNSVISENKTLNEKFEKQNEIQVEIAKTVELIADEPGAESAESKKKKSIKDLSEMTPLERYRALKSN